MKYKHFTVAEGLDCINVCLSNGLSVGYKKRNLDSWAKTAVYLSRDIFYMNLVDKNQGPERPKKMKGSTPCSKETFQRNKSFEISNKL